MFSGQVRLIDTVKGLVTVLRYVLDINWERWKDHGNLLEKLSVQFKDSAVLIPCIVRRNHTAVMLQAMQRFFFLLASQSSCGTDTSSQRV